MRMNKNTSKGLGCMNREKIKTTRITRIILLVISLICLIAVSIVLLIAQSHLFLGIPPLLQIIYVLISLMGCVLAVFSVMEVKEYVSHFRNLKDNVYRSHRLTYEQVMDNFNRKQLVESILEQPGIHYTLLRKKCNLHPGQFRWHIDILLDYGIIQKQHIDNHIIFFPTISDQEQNLDTILKFPLRDKIYSIIGSNPGIFSSEIARKLEEPQRRNTVKYHVDKLIQANYIRVVKNGKKNKLYLIEK